MSGIESDREAVNDEYLTEARNDYGRRVESIRQVARTAHNTIRLNALVVTFTFTIVGIGIKTGLVGKPGNFLNWVTFVGGFLLILSTVISIIVVIWIPSELSGINPVTERVDDPSNESLTDLWDHYGELFCKATEIHNRGNILNTIAISSGLSSFYAIWFSISDEVFENPRYLKWSLLFVISIVGALIVLARVGVLELPQNVES